jgi:hypothetical protein
MRNSAWTRFHKLIPADLSGRGGAGTVAVDPTRVNAGFLGAFTISALIMSRIEPIRQGFKWAPMGFVTTKVHEKN